MGEEILIYLHPFLHSSIHHVSIQSHPYAKALMSFLASVVYRIIVVIVMATDLCFFHVAMLAISTSFLQHIITCVPNVQLV